jgi:hypothetical protein
VADHFNKSDHRGTHDAQVTGLVSAPDDRHRFQLENRLISQLGTLQPDGINSFHSYI